MVSPPPKRIVLVLQVAISVVSVGANRLCADVPAQIGGGNIEINLDKAEAKFRRSRR
ncbi:hypothetical protein Poly41_56630 [Novipirellula artificiosorum]|uniref:Uncharacterized protein n=1 Tax=Novipirellula artificiosorum TaxID=2528016 RepID=A0A5C6D5S8_9BACT|nr:hypothetical protein Poly41_56630 [Novipirellula artificiosorum]